jgi:hypothetical protein
MSVQIRPMGEKQREFIADFIRRRDKWQGTYDQSCFELRLFLLYQTLKWLTNELEARK